MTEPDAPSAHAAATQTGVLFKTLQTPGGELRYAVYLPREYDASKAWPMIVFLHGYGESGTDGVRQCSVGLLPAVLNKPAEWPFVIILPQKPEFQPLWDKYAGQVFALMDVAQRELNIDPDRVYLTGLSQGGFGTWTLGAMHPERFAALAPICGFGDPVIVGPRVATLPIWAFHGLRDAVVTPQKSRDLYDAVQAARAGAGLSPVPLDQKLTEYPDLEHNSWDRAYCDEKLGQWFLRYRRQK